MKRLVNIFLHWLPLGVAIFLVFVLIYAVAQQIYRQSLNDPQIQIVRDAERALVAGKSTKEVVPQGTRFDAEKSLSPFVMVFDESGNPLESTALIGTEMPRPPAGIFDYAKVHGEHTVTWQPNPDTRIALVVRPVAIESGWFVASGRNMSLVESRIRDLTLKLFLGLIFTLFITFILDAFGDFWRRKYMVLK